MLQDVSVVLQDVSVVMGFYHFFYQIGREFMEFGRRGGRSGFGENNTEYSPKSSDRVYWVHQPCWSAEKCLLCQE